MHHKKRSTSDDYPRAPPATPSFVAIVAKAPSDIFPPETSGAVGEEPEWCGLWNNFGNWLPPGE